MEQTRRTLICAVALAPLAACVGTGLSYSLEDGLRRLLELSSQRAFNRLLQPGGFYDDQLTRIEPPAAPGQAEQSVLGAILRTGAVRRQLAIGLNEIAVDAADRAAPIVLDAVRRMSFADALSLARGGPTAATDILEREVGDRLVEAMFPEFSSGLASDLAEIIAAAAGARSGIDYVALARQGAGLASRSIFRAIGREEAAIRADPAATRDPAIIGLLAPARRF